jgi:hypothetical protein
MNMMRVAALGFSMFLTIASVTVPVSAKDPPSTTELLAWVACLQSAGVDPYSGQRSKVVLETAFSKCSSQESSLRRAIVNDPIHHPEYKVENMKDVLRAQQTEPRN